MLRKCAPCDGGCSAERTKDGKSGVFLYEKRAASGKNIANAVRLTIDAEAEAVKLSELHTFVVLPRWRVAGKVPPSLEKL
jgi:hypothetical protein